MDRAAGIGNDIASTRKGGMAKMGNLFGPGSGEIAVNISAEAIFVSRMKNEALVPCAKKVSSNPFYGDEVCFIGSIEVSSTRVDSVSYIRPCVLSKKIELANNRAVMNILRVVRFGIRVGMQDLSHWSGLGIGRIAGFWRGVGRDEF